MTANLGIMQVAPENGWVFMDTRSNDMLLYTSSPSQSILLGTKPDALSAVGINDTTVIINQPVKSYGGSLSINGVTLSNDAIVFKPGTVMLRHHPATEGLTVQRTDTDTLKYMNVRGVVVGKAVPYGNPPSTLDSNVDYTNILLDMNIERTLNLNGVLTTTAGDSNMFVRGHLVPETNHLYDIGSSNLRFADIYAYRHIMGYDDDNQHVISPNTTVSFVTSSNDTYPQVDWIFTPTSRQVRIVDQATHDLSNDILYIGDVLNSAAYPLVMQSKTGANSNVLVDTLGSGSVVISRYNDNGSPLWSTLIRSTPLAMSSSSCVARGLALYNSEDVVFALVSYSDADSVSLSWTPNGTTKIIDTAGTSGHVLAKYRASTGNLLWATHIRGVLPEAPSKVEVCQTTGHVFIVGSYNMTVEAFNSEEEGEEISTPFLNPLGSSRSAFVASYNTHGQLRWMSRIDSSRDETGTGIAVHNGSSIYACGNYSIDNPSISSTTITFGNQPSTIVSLNGPPAQNQTAQFLIKYNLDGAVQWSSRVYTDAVTDDAFSGTHVSTDRSSNVYLAGFFQSEALHLTSANISSTSNILQPDPTGLHSAFLAKYSSVGQLEWSALVNGIAYSNAMLQVATDPVTNHVILAGSYLPEYGLRVYDASISEISPLASSPSAEIVPHATHRAGAMFYAAFESSNGSLLWLHNASPNTPSASPLPSPSPTIPYITSMIVSSQQDVYFTGYYPLITSVPYILSDSAASVADEIWTPLSSPSSFLVRYLQTVSFKLVSDRVSAENGYMKLVHNLSQTMPVRIRVTDSDDENTLYSVRLSPDASTTFIWYDGQWINSTDRAVHQGDPIRVHSLQVGEESEPSAMITNDGHIYGKSLTLSQASVYITDDNTGLSVLNVTPSQLALGVPMVPGVGASSSNATLGTVEIPFDSVHVNKTFIGIDSATNNTILADEKGVTVLNPTQSYEAFTLSNTELSLQDGLIKHVVNVGSNVAVIDLNDKLYELQQSAALSLVSYSNTWYIMHRDNVTDQHVQVAGISTVSSNVSINTSSIGFNSNETILMGSIYPYMSNVNTEGHATILSGITGELGIVVANGVQFGSNAEVIRILGTGTGHTEVRSAYLDSSTGSLTYSVSPLMQFSALDQSVRIGSNAMWVSGDAIHVNALTVSNVYGGLFLRNESNQIWFGQSNDATIAYHSICTEHSDDHASSNAIKFKVWDVAEDAARVLLSINGDKVVAVQDAILRVQDTTAPSTTLSLNGWNIEAEPYPFGSSGIETSLKLGPAVVVRSSNLVTTTWMGGIEHPSSYSDQATLCVSAASSNILVGDSNGEPRSVFALVRDGTGVDDDANVATLALGRYGSNDGQSHSRLDVRLADTDAHDLRTVMTLCANGNIGFGGVTDPKATLHVHGSILTDAPAINSSPLISGTGTGSDTINYVEAGPIAYTDLNATETKWVKIASIQHADHQMCDIDAYFVSKRQQCKLQLMIMAKDRNIQTGTDYTYYHGDIVQGNIHPEVEPNLVVYQNGGLLNVWAEIPANTVGTFYVRSTDADGIITSLVGLVGATDSLVKYNLRTQFSIKHVSESRSTYIGGTLFAQNKYFSIRHPDPVKAKKGWFLQHCTVEAPTRGDNMYRFTAVADVPGQIVILPLPSYYPYLNEDSQVWVSPVGMFAGCYGELDPQNECVNVHCEKAGTYNVLVIGTRKDSYAVSRFQGEEVIGTI